MIIWDKEHWDKVLQINTVSYAIECEKSNWLVMVITHAEADTSVAVCCPMHVHDVFSVFTGLSPRCQMASMLSYCVRPQVRYSLATCYRKRVPRPVPITLTHHTRSLDCVSLCKALPDMHAPTGWDTIAGRDRVFAPKPLQMKEQLIATFLKCEMIGKYFFQISRGVHMAFVQLWMICYRWEWVEICIV